MMNELVITLTLCYKLKRHITLIFMNGFVRLTYG